MTIRRLLPTLLAAALLPACNRDPQPAPTTGSPGAANAPQTAIGKAAESALEDMRQKLASEDLQLGGNGNVNINGTRIGGNANLPDAHITPTGDFVVDGQQITLDARQRELALTYRRQMLGVAEAGLSLGVQGADLAGKALGEVARGLLSGNTEQIEERIKQEAKGIETDAMKLCAQLPAVLSAQNDLAASLAAFQPYATLTQQDVDECGRAGGQLGAQVGQQVNRQVTQGVQQAMQRAAASVSAASGASNTVTVNGVQFLFPPGSTTVDSRNDKTRITHAQGPSVELNASALIVDGRNYPRPASGSVVDLRTRDVVQIDEGTDAARP